MTAAIQSLDETTPASRIMRERDEARRKYDDLTDHCVKQGAYIAKLQSEAAHVSRRVEYLLGETHRLRHESYKRGEMIEDLLKNDAVGKDCTECKGRGYVGGECEVPDDYPFPVPPEEDCPNAYETCFGGREAR